MKFLLISLALFGAAVALPTSLQSKTIVCDACHKLIGQYLNNATLNQILQKTEHDVCDNLPADSQPQCFSSMNEKGQETIDYILKNINSDTLCASLNMCPATGKRQQLNFDEISTPAPTTQDDLACSACVAAVSALQTFLGDDAFQKYLKQALSSAACGQLPANMQSFCGALIDLIFPPLLKKLEEVMSVQALCYTVGNPPCLHWASSTASLRI